MLLHGHKKNIEIFYSIYLFLQLHGKIDQLVYIIS